MQGDTGWKSRHVVRPVATLKQQVVAGLRGSIEDLRFKPGERLVERELCEMLGVSRTLVREGLSQLAAEGLVQIIPHKGPCSNAGRRPEFTKFGRTWSHWPLAGSLPTPRPMRRKP